MPQDDKFLYERFDELGLSKEEVPAPKPVVTGSLQPCPLCGGPMRKRTSSFGEFFGCASYPKCKGARSLDGRDTTKGPRSPRAVPQPPLPLDSHKGDMGPLDKDDNPVDDCPF